MKMTMSAVTLFLGLLLVSTAASNEGKPSVTSVDEGISKFSTIEPNLFKKVQFARDILRKNSGLVAEETVRLKWEELKQILEGVMNKPTKVEFEIVDDQPISNQDEYDLEDTESENEADVPEYDDVMEKLEAVDLGDIEDSSEIKESDDLVAVTGEKDLVDEPVRAGDAEELEHQIESEEASKKGEDVETTAKMGKIERDEEEGEEEEEEGGREEERDNEGDEGDEEEKEHDGDDEQEDDKPKHHRGHGNHKHGDDCGHKHEGEDHLYSHGLRGNGFQGDSRMHHGGHWKRERVQANAERVMSRKTKMMTQGTELNSRIPQMKNWFTRLLWP